MGEEDKDAKAGDGDPKAPETLEEALKALEKAGTDFAAYKKAQDKRYSDLEAKGKKAADTAGAEILKLTKEIESLHDDGDTPETIAERKAERKFEKQLEASQKEIASEKLKTRRLELAGEHGMPVADLEDAEDEAGLLNAVLDYKKEHPPEPATPDPKPGDTPAPAGTPEGEKKPTISSNAPPASPGTDSDKRTSADFFAAEAERAHEAAQSAAGRK